MSQITDNFDIVVQLSQDALQKILNSMHVSNLLVHYLVQLCDTRRVELQINSPTVSLDTNRYGDNAARALLKTRVYYRSRDAAKPDDLGDMAVADVTIKNRILMSSGDPAPLVDGTYLLDDWSETSIEDITVYTKDKNLENQVRNDILSFIQNTGGESASMPQISMQGQSIGSLAFNFINDDNGSLITIGMNVGNNIKGSKYGLQQSVLQRKDWAIAISSNYIVQQILTQINQQLGVPPTQVQQSQFCALPTLLGCALTITQTDTLQNINVSLEAGYIQLSGSITRHFDPEIFPDITADFTTSITLSFDSDQNLQINVSQPQVQLQQWYAQLLNMLLSNTISNITSNAIETAIMSNVQAGGDFSTILSSKVINQLISAGTTKSIQVSAVPSSVQITLDAIIIRGSLENIVTSNPPITQFATAATDPAFPLRLVFNAGQSWSPGNTTVTYEFNFGDGSPPQISSDKNIVFAIDHKYKKPGLYRVCLTTTDSFGRTNITCQWIASGLMILHHNNPDSMVGPKLSEWQTCDADSFKATFTVTSSDGVPIDGAIVGAGLGRATVKGKADSNGKVTLELSQNQVQILNGQKQIVLRALMPNFQPVRHILTLISCQEILVIVNSFKKRINRIYKSLSPPISRKEGMPKKKKILYPSPPLVSKDKEIIMKKIAQNLQIVNTMFVAVTSGDNMNVIFTLLGINADSPDRLNQLDKRLNKVLDELEKEIKIIRKTG